MKQRRPTNLRLIIKPQVQTYLKETWVQKLRESIHTALAHVSKGWFNLEETSFEVYNGSKLKKLMELVKFAMQVYIVVPSIIAH